MKKVALTLLFLLVLAVAALGWLYFTAQVTIEDIRVTVTPAVHAPEQFASLQSQADADALVGTVFRQDALGDAEDYQFITYTLTVHNATLVDVELAEIQIAPMESDIVQIGATQPVTLPRSSVTTLTATLLTDAGAHSVRELTLTGFTWGHLLSLKAYTR